VRGADAGAGGSSAGRPGTIARGRSPRIGIVAACRFPAPRGSQVLVDGMAGALSAAGADVHLLAPVVPGCRRPFALHSLADPGGIPDAEPSAGSGPRRLLGDLRLAARLRAAVVRERIDVLHAHNYEALIASLRVREATGIPVVFHAHAVLADELPLYAPRGAVSTGMARRLGAWCDRTFPPLADLVVALSPDVADYLARCGADPRRIEVVPPGLAPDGLELARHEDAPRAVFTGNLDRYQNLDLLFAAWELVEQRLPAASLAIVTHERARAPLPRRGGTFGRVEVVQARTLAQVRREWARATVGVSPRASWSGFPVKTLNYMAAGLPTVALAASAKGVRDGETGWVVRDPSPEALAETLCEALDDPCRSADRGRRAREALAEEHAWPRLAARILGLSRAVAGAGRGRRLPTGGVEG